MMKFILLAIAFFALAQPSLQLTCYECKSANYQSSRAEFNDPRFQICGEDQKKWPTRTTSQIEFERCKKIVEKVNGTKKDEELIIRTIGIEDMKLDKKQFTEYTCKEDLCNSAVTVGATAFFAIFSVMATLISYL